MRAGLLLKDLSLGREGELRGNLSLNLLLLKYLQLKIINVHKVAYFGVACTKLQSYLGMAYSAMLPLKLS